MSLGTEKYLALTTYRKDGTPRSVPVWIAELGDGTVGFTTGSASYKVKRIRNDHRVQLQPSDGRGNVRPGTDAAGGTAVVTTGAELAAVKAAIKAKYGYQFHMMTAFGKLRSLMGKGDPSDIAVIVTLDG